MKLEDIIGENFTVSDLAEKSGKTVEEILAFAYTKDKPKLEIVPAEPPRRTRFSSAQLTPQRGRILALLRTQSATAEELAQRLNLAVPTLRRVLPVLVRSGHITKSKDRPAVYAVSMTTE